MEDQLIEVLSYSEEGYKTLVSFEGWRIAFLNGSKTKFKRENMSYLERHLASDECFILLSGQCNLYIGNGQNNNVGKVSKIELEEKKIYNVKHGVWHNFTGSYDMTVLIVENADTSKQNTEYFHKISPDMLPE